MDPRVMTAPDGLEGPVKIDLHVHSSFSDRPYSWFLRSSHAAECYTSPATVYATAKARGMNLVTLCDHDTIDVVSPEQRGYALPDRKQMRVAEVFRAALQQLLGAQRRQCRGLRNRAEDVVDAEHRTQVGGCIAGRLTLAGDGATGTDNDNIGLLCHS